MAGVKTGISGQINNNIVTDGLVFYTDPAYKSSYSRTGTTTTDIVSQITGTGTGYTFDTSNQGILDFDGTSDYITCPDSSVTDPQTSFSLNIWVKLSALNRQHGLIEKYNWSSGLGNFTLRVTSANKVAFYTVVGTSYDELISNASVSQDIWYNFCVTQNHNTDTATIYINGIQDNQSTSFDTGPADSTTTMKIGARGDDASNRLQGKLSCVQIYHKALSAGEVLQNYQAQKERFGL